MTEASTTAPTDDGRVECLDKQGSEVFPADNIALAQDLAALLEPEFVSQEAGDTLLHNIGVTAKNIARTYRRAANLYPLNYYWLKMQRVIRENVVDEIAEREPTYEDYFAGIKRAARKLAPQETEYFLDIIEADGKITEDDLVQAGQLNQASRASRLLGKAPRLHENTAENLEKLDETVFALRNLMLLENQELTMSVLDVCLALGDRKHVNTAAALLNRMRNIACDEQMDLTDKMLQQGSANMEIGRVAGSVNLDHLDPETARRAKGRIISMHSTYLTNWKLSQALTTVLYGRAFRLNGNRHPIPLSPEPEAPAEPAVEASPEPEPVPEPEPDFFGIYKAKLQGLQEATDFIRFELLPAKEIKRRLLDEARGVLVKGESDKDGNLLVGGRSKSETHRYISSIEFLRSFIIDSGDMSQAREQLEKAVTDSARHADGLKALLGEAESKLSSKLAGALRNLVPDTHRVGDVATYIRDDWSTASHVIKNYWPDGKQVVEQLSQLLFPPEQTEVAPQDMPVELLHDQEVTVGQK